MTFNSTLLGATESEAITTLSNHNYNLDSAVSFYINNHTSGNQFISETSGANNEGAQALSASVDALNQESADVIDVETVDRSEVVSAVNARRHVGKDEKLVLV